MTRIRLKYVHQFVDKRYGKPRFYFRRPGIKQIPLPGLPGSPEFNAAYEQAVAGVVPGVGTRRIRAGSFDALVLAYFNSPTFLTRSPSTRRTYRAILERFTREHGEKPVAALMRQHINAMLA